MPALGNQSLLRPKQSPMITKQTKKAATNESAATAAAPPSGAPIQVSISPMGESKPVPDGTFKPLGAEPYAELDDPNWKQYVYDDERPRWYSWWYPPPPPGPGPSPTPEPSELGRMPDGIKSTLPVPPTPPPAPRYPTAPLPPTVTAPPPPAARWNMTNVAKAAAAPFKVADAMARHAADATMHAAGVLGDTLLVGSTVGGATTMAASAADKLGRPLRESDLLSKFNEVRNEAIPAPYEEQLMRRFEQTHQIRSGYTPETPQQTPALGAAHTAFDDIDIAEELMEWKQEDEAGAEQLLRDAPHRKPLRNESVYEVTTDVAHCRKQILQECERRGLDPSNKAHLKKVHRDMSKAFHSDKRSQGGAGSNEAMTALNTAIETLLDGLKPKPTAAPFTPKPTAAPLTTPTFSASGSASGNMGGGGGGGGAEPAPVWPMFLRGAVLLLRSK